MSRRFRPEVSEPSTGGSRRSGSVTPRDSECRAESLACVVGRLRCGHAVFDAMITGDATVPSDRTPSYSPTSVNVPTPTRRMRVENGAAT